MPARRLLLRTSAGLNAPGRLLLLPTVKAAWLYAIRLVAILFFCVAFAAAPSFTFAELTPDSPEVQRLIDTGMKFLENNTDNRLGGKCLVGLCQLKHTGDVKHPRVVEAVDACQDVCRADAINIKQDIYSTGIAIFFLCEVDAEQYGTAIEKLVESLLLRQKEGGGFGYPGSHRHGDTGDTSMTQYAALGLWAAKQHGIAVPREAVERMANWLIRTQDPSGAWGYQGNDPGTYRRRVEQEPIRPSLAAAGLGSTYICAHMLGLKAERPDRTIEGLPPAFQRVVEKEPQKDAPKLETVDPRLLHRAQLDGNRWLSRNFGFDETEPWVYYYMYALERCMSFRELVEDRKLSNVWYEMGVRFLTAQQNEDGSWRDRFAAVDTAFAVLFLMRGTKKTIETTVSEHYDGLLVGGRGLPRNTRNVRVEDGRLIGKSLSASIDEMLAILEDPQHARYNDMLRFPPDLDLETDDPAKRRKQIERLQKIALADAPAAQVRAIELLARSGELEVAPTLIAALGDGDLRVVLAARDGLRRLSRKFSGFGLSDDPTAAEVAVAADKWRTWYRSVSLEAE